LNGRSRRFDLLKSPTPSRGGFTLIELLVVMAIVGVLAALLFPALRGAKDKARSVGCISNLRQLTVAALLYCEYDDDYFPPSSWDIYTTNRHRWHGERDNQGEPFDFRRSPLYTYLKTDRIKGCPVFAEYLTGFEAGCGGYGYNDGYVGSGRGDPRDKSSRPARRGQIGDPANTVMFADCAFLGGPGAGGLIEYSFVTEPVYEAWGSTPSTPSIHFRHQGRANVSWCDGHVSSEPMGYSNNHGFFPGYDFAAHNIGYVGTFRDNRLYDRD
jgi:prepilin-type N-terminal cleavage/methylation domain-containing protein/prepilin-type processing-associated H-X9-DG protein